jgi:hypothetical protein
MHVMTNTRGYESIVVIFLIKKAHDVTWPILVPLPFFEVVHNFTTQ